MYFYNVLPTKNIGNSLILLTYSSLNPLKVGNIVEIDIRNKIDYGLIVSVNKEFAELYKSVGGKSKIESKLLDIDTSKRPSESGFSTHNEESLEKVKSILSVIPFKLSSSQLNFIKLFGDNTFNSLNDVWDSCWRPFELLTKKQFLELQNKFLTESSSQTQTKNDIVFNLFNNRLIDPKIEFELNSEYLIRIIYIIRNIISDFNTSQKSLNQDKSANLVTILVIFPEIKLLNRIYSEFEKFLNSKDSNLPKTVNCKIYSGAINKNSKQTAWSLINPLPTSGINQDINLQIIFSTRNGIFLPFKSLAHIILVDESNSMYIQDQNSLYYDTREAIFLLSKAFLSSLTFISRVPSIRLHSFYPEKVLEYNSINISKSKQNSPKVKITRYDGKSAKFELFGWEIEQILRKDEDIEHMNN